MDAGSEGFVEMLGRRRMIELISDLDDPNDVIIQPMQPSLKLSQQPFITLSGFHHTCNCHSLSVATSSNMSCTDLVLRGTGLTKTILD